MLFCNSWKINDLAGNILNIWSCFWKTSCHVWFKNTSYSIEDDIKATFLRDRMVQSQVGLILSPSCLYVGERSFVRLCLNVKSITYLCPNYFSCQKTVLYVLIVQEPRGTFETFFFWFWWCIFTFFPLLLQKTFFSPLWHTLKTKFRTNKMEQQK